MPKNVVRDIVRNPKRKLPERAVKPPVETEAEIIANRIDHSFSQIPKAPDSRKIFDRPDRTFDMSKKANFAPPTGDAGSKIALWIIAGVSVVILLFALSTLFTGATVTITPKKSDFNLADASFQASKDPQIAGLPFEVMVLSDSETRSIKATKTMDSEIKATGQVIIYNNFSKDSQKLVVNTRLETTDGKIYRLDQAITVPGTTVKSGQTVPGSVEAFVHADQAGEEYNIPLSDFTIPGFKGDPRYEKFYARSKTEMSGGIKGTINVVDEAEALKARNEMVNDLKEKLTKKAIAETPKGFVLYDDAILFDAGSENVNFGSKTEEVPVKVDAKVSAIILDEKKLTNKIAEIAVRDFGVASETGDKTTDSEGIFIANIRELHFAIQNKDTLNIADVSSFSFNLGGAGIAIWNVDEDKLKLDLIGKSKKDLQAILANYLNIEDASASVKPFWKSTFPGRKEDIKIINTAITLK